MSKPVERRLTAILSADIVNFTTLIRRDEVGTINALRQIRLDLVRPKTEEYNGRSIKLLGDGELFEFPSVIDATLFAIDVQLAMRARNKALPQPKRITFRMGITIGDVIREGRDIYGQGVNLASRVERNAKPGAICLTGPARMQIPDNVGLTFRNSGKKTFKGFPVPVELLTVVFDKKAKEAVRRARNEYALQKAQSERRVLGLIKRKKPPAAATPGHSTAQHTSSKILWARAFAAIAIIYGLGGTVQYLADGEIAPGSLFCPLVKLTTSGPDAILLGAVADLGETHGHRMRWGIERAIRDKRNQYGRDFSVRFIDSAKGWDLVKPELDALLQHNLASVIGPMASATAYHAKKWANRNQIPTISPLATASYLTQRGVQDYFFRTTMSDGARAEALVNWLRAKNLEQMPYILHEWVAPEPDKDMPEIYGAQQASAVKAHLGEVKTIRFARGEAEAWSEAVRQVENDGRAIMIFGYTSNIKIIIEELQDKGIENPIFLMGVVTKTLEDTKFVMPGKIHVVTPIISEVSGMENARRLRRDFEDENPDLEYDLSAYYAYDTVTIALDAIEAASKTNCVGRYSGKKIAEALRQTPAKERKTINAGFLYDIQELHFQFVGLQIINGKFQQVGLSQ